ncbi:MFS general substrate transporter [Hesseltinella vesiculosa]|uniref:MFS general substrate transporter n=1 Tax=Hesseltinella vesiculosa TaxID=101127 RepID=A0A1X2GD37_9FUNG|nr:MFS general substrate transporter [Hesseltinella vesiculosa]
MDRTNISNAISDNMAGNLGFTLDGFNTATMMYAIIFCATTLVSSSIAKKVGPHRYIPVLMTSWALNYAGFMVVRAFIALTEGGFIPSCLVYLTGWYKSRELGPRLALFWGIQSFANALSGLIAAGIFNLSGVANFYGWQWLFLIDGIATHVVGFVAFFYLPGSPANTTTLIWRQPWFTERERKIAVTRLIRDDLSKKEQSKPVTLADVKLALTDTRLLIHLIIAFTGMMYNTPISGYLPTIIKQAGFNVIEANLLTAPAYIMNLVVSIVGSNIAQRYGGMSFICAFFMVWTTVGLLVMEFLPANVGRWSIYGAVLVTGGTPNFHPIHVAWMSSNLAPIGKRTLALGAVIGMANLCSVPGAFIYQQSDAPRYHRGNWILIGLQVFTAILLVVQHLRYKRTNQRREKVWNALTEQQQKHYAATTTDQGNNRLDYRFDF